MQITLPYTERVNKTESTIFFLSCVLFLQRQALFFFFYFVALNITNQTLVQLSSLLKSSLKNFRKSVSNPLNILNVMYNVGEK